MPVSHKLLYWPTIFSSSCWHIHVSNKGRWLLSVVNVTAGYFKLKWLSCSINSFAVTGVICEQFLTKLYCFTVNKPETNDDISHVVTILSHSMIKHTPTGSSFSACLWCWCCKKGSARFEESTWESWREYSVCRSVCRSEECRHWEERGEAGMISKVRKTEDRDQQLWLHCVEIISICNLLYAVFEGKKNKKHGWGQWSWMRGKATKSCLTLFVLSHNLKWPC